MVGGVADGADDREWRAEFQTDLRHGCPFHFDTEHIGQQTQDLLAFHITIDELVATGNVAEIQSWCEIEILDGLLSHHCINSDEKREEIMGLLPDVLCVEMEGAAVAQVCLEFGTPFTVIRTISDTANHNARVDFGKFIVEVANAYSRAIVQEIMRLL